MWPDHEDVIRNLKTIPSPKPAQKKYTLMSFWLEAFWMEPVTTATITDGINSSVSRTLKNSGVNADEKRLRGAHFAQFWCNLNPFRINTYRNARKC